MGSKTSSPVQAIAPESQGENAVGHQQSIEASFSATRAPGKFTENYLFGNQTLKLLPDGGYELEDPNGVKKQIADDVVDWFKRRNGETLQGSLAFVPWIVQQAYFDGGAEVHEEGAIVIHRGSGAVVFSDASGFTALTERLATKSNGAELLSQCLTSFFTPLINLITAYRGDVIKFSGDALMIYFPAVDDTQGEQKKFKVPPHGSYGLEDIGPMATAVLRASACCIEIQKRLHMFDTGVDGVKLCLHIGVGCGEVAILQVGGEEPPETHIPRVEYIIAGPPIAQISVAEPLAKNGETCVSPEAWEYVKDCMVEDTSRKLENPNFHLLLKLDESKYTFPTVKASAVERDRRIEKRFSITELNVIRKFVPSAVFKQIEGDTLTYVNEMRVVSTVFISCSGVDVSTDEGAKVAQELMSSVQRICYANEGTLNKFLVDDKGLLFLLVYGLPPLVHTDDPTRAVLSCFDIVKAFKRLKLTARCGVSTGRAYCGICGCPERMEYTVLGDYVNLAARLMGNAPEHGILVDKVTADRCSMELAMKALPPIKVKGKTNAVELFQPELAATGKFLGIGPDGRINFPWYSRPMSSGYHEMDNLAEQLRQDVLKLCRLQDWKSMSKVQSMLGNAYSAELHDHLAHVPDQFDTKQTAGWGSPFTSGGTVFLQGPTGLGKVELVTHVVAYAAANFGMLPVFGTMGPRVQDLERLGVELIRSCLGAFRHLDRSLPADDAEALKRLEPTMKSGDDPVLLFQKAMSFSFDEDERKAALDRLVEIAVDLLKKLKRKKVPIVVVLWLDYGTVLFPKTIQYFNVFWTVLSELTPLTEAGGEKPLVIFTVCKNVDPDHPAVKVAQSKGWLIDLAGLSQDSCKEYMAAQLDVPERGVPEEVSSFVAELSLGNPLYIRETLKQLVEEGHIAVAPAEEEGKEPRVVQRGDLEEVEIAAWSQTAMVGETMCLLESLDPLEAAVLKMATVFKGTFVLTDLASSSCSRWSGANRFDYLRLFRAVRELEARGIFHKIQSRPRLNEAAEKKPDSVSALRAQFLNGAVEKLHVEVEMQAFEMKNVLIRKVGNSMLLEAQKKKVKRQALIDRALQRDLPARMEELRAKKNEPHIPWYYENILPRG